MDNTHDLDVLLAKLQKNAKVQKSRSYRYRWNTGDTPDLAKQLGKQEVVMVTNAMLPLLRKSDSGRIVNLSSAMGSWSFASDSGSQYVNLMSLAYNSSKTALNSITLEYAKELRGTSIKINAVSPGYVATDLNRHQGYLTPEQDAGGETPW